MKHGSIRNQAASWRLSVCVFYHDWNWPSMFVVSETQDCSNSLNSLKNERM